MVEIAEEPADYKEQIRQILVELVRFIDPEADIESDESVYLGLRFNILVREARSLIGEHGANLLHLEYLAKRLVQKKLPDAPNFSVDVNDYKMRRAEFLRDEVKIIAKKVRMYRKSILLKPPIQFYSRYFI